MCYYNFAVVRIKNKVSCIIPAYNEGPRIRAVLDVISTSPFINEIIVINDGSKDDTKKVVEQYQNVKLISYSENKGKTFAVMMGLLQAKNDIIMLLDADLAGLTRADIGNLVSPVVSKKVDVSMSICQNSLLPYRILGVDFASGQRVFHKKIISDFGMLEQLPEYGLEVFLNNIIIENKLKLKIVNWKKVIAIRKSQKVGWWYGNLGEIKMTSQILSTVSFPKLVFQTIHLRSLSAR